MMPTRFVPTWVCVSASKFEAAFEGRGNSARLPDIGFLLAAA